MNIHTKNASASVTYIATCRAWPQGNACLQALAADWPATLLPWQDIDPEAISRAGVPATVLPLAAWDYSESPEAYRDWLNALQEAGVCVINPPELQTWNMDKRYLCELAGKGLPVTPSVALLPGEDWGAQMAASGWRNPVIKPLIGQSGRGVRRLSDAEVPTAEEYPQGALLQPFVPTDVGEVCLIYLGENFSHAAHRRPAPDEWRANSAYGVQIHPIVPQAEWLAIAESVLHHLPQTPVYARVDGLIAQDGSFLLNEVELIEPALYAHLCPKFSDGVQTMLAR